MQGYRLIQELKYISRCMQLSIQGLPLPLLLESFLNKKINFKPLLDQLRDATRTNIAFFQHITWFADKC